MFSLTGLLVGLAMVGFGLLTLKYTFWLHNTTGPQSWIERYLGSGSTYGVYKILGVLLVIIGVLVGTGFGDNVMGFFFAPLVNIFRAGGGAGE
jgi:hypothetical protein